MKTHFKTVRTLALGFTSIITISCQANTYLFDDFDDGVVDGSLWITAFPQGSSSIQESSGLLTTAARASLGTHQSFTEIRLQGRVTLNNDYEHFKIALRSDLSRVNDYYELTGILVAFSNDGNEVSIQVPGATEWVSKPYPIETGRSYDFEVIDTGSWISLFIDGQIQIETDAVDYYGNQIGFYSREFSNTSSSLDFIRVSDPQCVADGGGTFLLTAFPMLGIFIFATTRR